VRIGPPSEDRLRLLELINGGTICQAVGIAARLRIADRLVVGPKNAEELARETGVRPRPLFRVLRALAAFGVFAQDRNDRFRLSPLGELLRSDVRGSLRALADDHSDEVFRGDAALLHTVETGETAFNHVFGMGRFEYLASHPEASRRFNEMMLGRTLEHDEVARAWDFSRYRTVVDVGGGRGGLIGAILKAHPNVRGLLFDLPNVVPDAEEYLRGQGVLNRCKVVGGSFFDGVPSGGEVYIASSMLHDWGDSLSMKILSRIRAVIPPGGRLLLVEMVLPSGSIPRRSALNDLRMLSTLGGQERTESEWRTLLRSGGFAVEEVVDANIPPRGIIVARPV